MAQPPISRADAMPMAIDIVGDRYNFGRSAGNGKQKCFTSPGNHRLPATPRNNKRSLGMDGLVGTYVVRSIVSRAGPASLPGSRQARSDLSR